MVIDCLRAKDLLLILDNCEHLIEACAQLAGTLLRLCPHLIILASSREGARHRRARPSYRVPSLLPELQTRPAKACGGTKPSSFSSSEPRRSSHASP